jgi:hypothetical protein
MITGAKSCVRVLGVLIPLSVVACNAPPKDPPVDVAATASARPAAAAEVPVSPSSNAATAGPAATTGGAASAPAPPATPAAPAAAESADKGSGCKSDADCRMYTSYCSEAPCVCRVFTKGEPDPHCTGNVRCFANPCLKKAARCQSGACVLTQASSTDK